MPALRLVVVDVGRAAGGKLNQLQQDAARALGMHEGDQAVGAGARLVVDELVAGGFQLTQAGVDIVDFQGDVVDPLAALVDEALAG